ncbi:MAG: ImmA/IrrE family metallo-endopeptidase [Planctomycetes bacterium]|nr:ImmA/IrrE family metallo-endopeptidase [Planctomycetota bacterium]
MIFINPNLPADRWRLTLAYELGHIVLHHHLNIPPDEQHSPD